jgi:hypothetical protein
MRCGRFLASFVRLHEPTAARVAKKSKRHLAGAAGVYSGPFQSISTFFRLLQLKKRVGFQSQISKKSAKDRRSPQKPDQAKLNQAS